MDQMTQLRLMWLGGLVGLFGLGIALGWIFTTLVELRERRESQLLGAVRAQLGSAGIATRARVEARWGLLSRRPVVALDMGNSSDEDVWRAISRLSQSLPRHVRLVVSTAAPHSLAWTVKVGTSPPGADDRAADLALRRGATGDGRGSTSRATPSDVSRNAA